MLKLFLLSSNTFEIELPTRPLLPTTKIFMMTPKYDIPYFTFLLLFISKEINFNTLTNSDLFILNMWMKNLFKI